MNEIQFFIVDGFGAFMAGAKDVHEVYEHACEIDTVRDDALFWSLKDEKVWVAFVLRQKLEFAPDECPPVHVSAGSYALYINLHKFPLEVVKRIQSMAYFDRLKTYFGALEVGFGKREASLMRDVFPAQTIPEQWRGVSVRHESVHTVCVKKYGRCHDVTVDLVPFSWRIKYNVDAAPFRVEKDEFVRSGVEIVEKRFDAELRPKASALFTVALSEKYINANGNNISSGELNALALRASGTAAVSDNCWTILHRLVRSDNSEQFVVGGLRADRHAAVEVWKGLLERRIGVVIDEQLSSEDHTWLLFADHLPIQSVHVHAWMRWRLVHDEIRDYAFALAAVGFPPYIILDLIDWTTIILAQQNELKKITLIVSVINSMRRVVAQRKITQ